MQCSVGVNTSEDCQKTSYSATSEIRSVNDLSQNERVILALRVSEDLETICTYHEKKFLIKYNHLFGGTCCDPLKVHKKPIKKSLREISVELATSVSNKFVLIPGKSLCSACFARIQSLRYKEGSAQSKMTDVNMDLCEPSAHESESDYEPIDAAVQDVNKVCEVVGVSPFKHRKLSTKKRKSAAKKKFLKITKQVKKKLELSCDDVAGFSSDTDNGDCCEETCPYPQLVGSLKEKLEKVTSKSEKIKILSLFPTTWSIRKTARECKVSEYLVHQSRTLVSKYGVLPDLERRQPGSGKPISEADIEAVLQFYNSDDVSRMCPGMKDYVNVRRTDGTKEQKKKRLILCNLKELHVKFCDVFPDIKISFSKFADLRPRWCVLAGASGTHCVCVCMEHQNVKLMVTGAKLPNTYKELLSKVVCSIENEDCMLHGCPNCPGTELLRQYLCEIMDVDNELLDSTVNYKQWITTDRCELLSMSDTDEDFIERLINKIMKLRMHHYIAKRQSEYIKDRKSNLKPHECIVQGDFAENFTFILQDEIQSYHWVNAQATVHPFVLYFKKKNDADVTKESFCIISDCLNHTADTVYTFQKYMITFLKKAAPNVQNVIYFSDGAASQYKNRKNFINLSHHFEDFGLNAEWHFFATSHGKGPCDGVGGTTKRLVAKASLQRTHEMHITIPKEMFTFCRDNIPGVKYSYVTKEKVEETAEFLAERFHSSITIKHTRGFHSFIPVNKTTIRVRQTSFSANFEDTRISIEEDCGCNVLFVSVKIGSYVACIYDGKWWLGVVKDICEHEQDFHVHFFHPCGPSTSFKLSKDDYVWVKSKNILKVLSPLEITTPTGRVHNIKPEMSEAIESCLNSRP